MYKVNNYSHLIGLEGFSEQLLKNHFSLYEGYVNNTNKLLELLDQKEPGTIEYSELQRRFGWEWNGIRLHELYFENLTKESNDPDETSSLGKKITKIYGSYENWKKNFISVGSMRGIGWVILYHDPIANELFNVWVNEHDSGHLASCKPLLIMDVFEHAFMLDYGTKRADYINAFFKTIKWEEIQKRFE